ncbi:MAG: hypothetical protein JWQ90_368 [Hydrocarboniphaga sp.]|uniref:hypothetical protein n=1 Tax=Hydrocarboniphaga sp. TaxID=2033016 RepID=UPI00261541DD|nr:hypothetical protein [Hydrocarboniphaga sp.]MDB5967918.1 hypothetical protein [Hydrocarboniphaga sp.]
MTSDRRLRKVGLLSLLLTACGVQRCEALAVPEADHTFGDEQQPSCAMLLNSMLPRNCLIGKMSMSLGVASAAPAASLSAREKPASAPSKGQSELDVRVSTSVWSGNRKLDDQTGVVYPRVNVKAAHKMPSGVSLFAEGYVGDEYSLQSDKPRAQTAIRELHLGYKHGAASGRVGLQIIPWGRADVVNPTDNISAYDYTLLVPDDAEQRLGVPTASLVYRMESASLQTLWQPFFRASEIPLPPISGARYRDDKPEGLQASAGIRLDVSGEPIAWSLSYFRGPSKPPNLALAPARVAQGILDTNHPIVSTYGLDFESLAGRWVLRGEAAYNHVDGSDSDPLASRESFALGVLGVERSFGEASAFFQITYRRIFDFIDPYEMQEPFRELALANATVNAETAQSLLGFGTGFALNTSDLRWSAAADLAYFPATEDFSIRPRLRYQVSDAVSLWIGADYLRGPSTASLGRLADNTAGWLGFSVNALDSSR